MRGLLLVPFVVLGIATTSVRSQPGPEIPPPAATSDAPVAIEAPAIASPDPGMPIESADQDPIATPTVETSPPDTLAVPTSDSATSDTPDAPDASPRVSDTTDAPSPSAVVPPPGTMDSYRQGRGGKFDPRYPKGMPEESRRPPIVAPAAPVVEEPVVPYEDERGAGRKLKNDPRAHKLYRSPRKAFFYSLVLPGSGQAWAGAYVRAAVFVAAEVGLLYGWHDVSIRQAREKTRESERFADANWSASRYEATRKRYYDTLSDPDEKRRLSASMPYRDRYCQALYADDLNTLRDACIDIPNDSNLNYQNHVQTFADEGLGVAEVHAKRVSGVKELATFYERIGRDEEFVPGWRDATSDTVTVVGLLNYQKFRDDKDPSTIVSATPWGVSQMRAQYLGMRREADDLAATQGWFLGGLVVNHIVSAIDAALAAQRSNRKLYDEEKTSWIDGLHLQGGLAWSNGPATRADMFLEF